MTMLKLSSPGLLLSLVLLIGCSNETNTVADGGTSQDTGAPAPVGYSEVKNFGHNPGDLTMFRYVPASRPLNAPLVVLLHGCGDTARNFGTSSGWTSLAEKKGLYLLLPQQKLTNNMATCFNWFQAWDHTRGQGEVSSVEQMITWMKRTHRVDPRRIFVTGLSAGGAMTAAFMAAYPELVAGGAVMAGVPAGCASSLLQSQGCLGGKDLSAKQWGDLVRKSASAPAGGWPGLVIFHGAADVIVSPKNLVELAEQWTNVHGADATADKSEIVAGHTVRSYKDPAGKVVVMSYLLSAMGHGVAVNPGTGPGEGGQTGLFYFDVNLWSALHAANFWQL